MKCQDFSGKGSNMDIHFGVEWFENVHNFGVVGTGIRGVQISVKCGSPVAAGDEPKHNEYFSSG